MLAWVKVSTFSLLKKRNWEKILRREGDSLSRINVFSYEQCVRLISGNRMVIILYTMQSKAKLTGVLLEVIFFYRFLIVPFLLLTLGRTCKFIPPPWYKWVGWMDPPLEFLICCSVSKRFYLRWKAFDILYRMRYILWVVALLGGLWRHQKWPPSWILPRIRNQVKTARNGDFLCLRGKITQNKHFAWF